MDTTNLKHQYIQGSKCEEWKDEKKGSATVLYTQIINSQLVYTVHGTHFAEGSAAPQIDQSHFTGNLQTMEIVRQFGKLQSVV